MAYRKAVVDDIYKNHICSDTRHTDLNKVLQKTIAQRSFSEWSMGFVRAKEIESLMILHSDAPFVRRKVRRLAWR